MVEVFLAGFLPDVRYLVVMLHKECILPTLVFVSLVHVHIGRAQWEIVLEALGQIYSQRQPYSESLRWRVEGNGRVVNLMILSWHEDNDHPNLKENYIIIHLQHSKYVVFLVNWLNPNVRMEGSSYRGKIDYKVDKKDYWSVFLGRLPCCFC